MQTFNDLTKEVDMRIPFSATSSAGNLSASPADAQPSVIQCAIASKPTSGGHSC